MQGHRRLALRCALAALAILLCLATAPPLLADDYAIVQVAAGTSDVQIAPATVRLRFCGFSAAETGGAAPAQLDFYAGTSASGVLLYPARLVAGESTADGPWSECLPAPQGIFLDRQGAGTVKLAVYYRVDYPPR